jgi:hypothetical protein
MERGRAIRVQKQVTSNPPLQWKMHWRVLFLRKIESFYEWAYNNSMEVKRHFSKIKEEQAQLRQEIKERTIGYLVAAFGVVAGLAWNDAVKALISVIFPNPGKSVTAQFLYAIIVTIVIVIITVYLVRLTQKDHKEHGE